MYKQLVPLVQDVDHFLKSLFISLRLAVCCDTRKYIYNCVLLCLASSCLLSEFIICFSVLCKVLIQISCFCVVTLILHSTSVCSALLSLNQNIATYKRSRFFILGTSSVSACLPESISTWASLESHVTTHFYIL